MYDAVTEEAKNSDIIIKAAAVADYTPLNVSDNKIKKKDGDMSIDMDRTTDIIKNMAKKKTTEAINREQEVMEEKDKTGQADKSVLSKETDSCTKVVPIPVWYPIPK